MEKLEKERLEEKFLAFSIDLINSRCKKLKLK
jgi:hypothetical protein